MTTALAKAGDTVLIAALSGRALAQSARRAGLIPYVVDAFGDLDMRDAASDYAVIERAAMRGFTAKALLPALDRLSATASSPPVALVLGSGFEGTPRLMHVLAERYPLVGAPMTAIEQINDPLRLATLLSRLAIPHPETSLQRPDDANGWLSKRPGGTGGGHITLADNPPPKRARRRYFQRRHDGKAYSVFAIAHPQSTMMAVTHQWTTPSPKASFRYGGAVRIENTPHDRHMRAYAQRLIDELDLRGLLSFDFLVADDKVYLLEINARPGATLDVFETDDVDDGPQSLFATHLEVCTGDSAPCPAFSNRMAASAILYATDATFTMPEIDWPAWSADRTPPGTQIAPFAPLATVKCAAPTTDAAMKLLASRLAELEGLIYEQVKT